MKTILLSGSGILAAAILYFHVGTQPAQAQSGQRSSPGTPPVGRLVDVQLIAWPISTVAAYKVSGTLVAMTDQWIIVEAGNQEVWVPKEKVMTMTASR